MGTFSSSRTVPYIVEDLAPVAQDVMRHFEQQDFEVTETHIPTGGVQVSIRKGGTFEPILGLRTALNIRIEPVANGTRVEAGVGIFGQQAIPTAITLLVFWPVIIAQVWNMAQEAKLDEEALRVAEESLKARSEVAPGEPEQYPPQHLKRLFTGFPTRCSLSSWVNRGAPTPSRSFLVLYVSCCGCYVGRSDPRGAVVAQ